MRRLPALLARHRRSLGLLFVGVLLPLGLFAELVDEVFREGGFGWDRAVLGWFAARRTGGLTGAAHALAWLGGGWGLPPLVLAGGAVLVRRGARAQGWFLGGAVGGAAALNVLAKLLFQRPRPTGLGALVREAGFSFPSGHAMSNAALGCALILIFGRSRPGWPLALAGGLWALAVGTSRVYLGVHYPSDVLAGFAASVAWVVGLYLILSRRWPTLRRPPPGGGAGARARMGGMTDPRAPGPPGERRSRPGPTLPGPVSELADAAQALRRRAYLGALGFVGPALVGVWGLEARQAEPDPFVMVGHPALLGLCGGVAAWLLRGRPLLTAERVVALGLTLALLARLALALGRPGDETFGALNETYWLLVVVACVGFLMFSARGGLGVAGGLYVLAGLAPWAAGAGEARLLQVQLTCGVVLVLLYSLAWYRERFLAERGERLLLERLASTDPLTGLPNRRALYRAVEALLAGGAGGCLILFDLDHFKRVNDAYGHGAGDEVLVGAARRVEAALRGGDPFGRWGGEEFLIVLPGVDPEAGAAVAERLRGCLAAHPFGAVGRVTASFGVAGVWPEDDLSACTARADAALYRAKAAGRDRVALAAAPERDPVV